jgi:hypothetical protein
MIETPQIIQTQAQAAAVIRLTVPRSEMMKVFGPAVGELMAALAAQGVEPPELPAAKVARTIYHGPYDGLPSAWGEFDKWMRANGHEQAGSLWELYPVGPQLTPDPANWRTELNRPLKN